MPVRTAAVKAAAAAKRSARRSAAVAAGGAFRINRKNIGLTYACPVGGPNPITTKEEILEFVTDKFGPSQYVVGHELHESGESHYHAYLKFDAKVDTTDPRAFDLKGVHPNVLAAGLGWQRYCRKHGDYLTNMDKRNVAALAMGASSVDEGMKILKELDPTGYLRFGESMERNLRRHLAESPQLQRFHGPYPAARFPAAWDFNTHSLLIWGPPGAGKTSFAMYLAGTLWANFEYCRARMESLRSISLSRPFIFDEVDMSDQPAAASRELTHIINGGAVRARNTDILIRPGLLRIFLSNLQFPFANPDHSVYGRRVFSMHYDFSFI